MQLRQHAWPRNQPLTSASPNHSQNPPRFRVAPLCRAGMPWHMGLQGKHIQGRVKAWMGLVWITLVWVQSHMTQNGPFCMAAVLHGKPGLGPDCGPDRRREGMSWKAKLMY